MESRRGGQECPFGWLDQAEKRPGTSRLLIQSHQVALVQTQDQRDVPPAGPDQLSDLPVFFGGLP